MVSMDRSTEAISSAQRLSSSRTRCSWGTRRLYLIWCSKLAQQSMAMVRSWTSTVIPFPGPSRMPRIRW